MGSAETGQASKMPPKGSATQEQSPVVSSSPAVIASSSSGVVYPDWSGFQAYSPVPPHGFFPPVASSPQTHPYMWGTQNMMAPYGTPPPPFVMYPHGGVYVHPSVSPAAHPFSPYTAPSPGGNPEGFNPTPETEGKSSEGKEGSNLKRSNGSLGNLNPTARKAPRVIEKPSGASVNGVFSHSESVSDGSSRGSDSDSPNDSPGKAATMPVRVLGNGDNSKSPLNRDMTQQLAVLPALPGGTAGAVAGPATNLNIGMDYWGAGAVATVRGKVHVPSNQSIPQELRLQDEREVKRERRKQSNRESARRSRLRKQAECEDLAQRVEVLQQENTSLAAEASRIRKEYEQLLSDNNSLKERLGQSSLEAEDPQQFRDEEGKAP